MTLIFSTFYASVSSEKGGLCVHPHARTTHEQSIEMINMLFRSADYFNPHARYSILTSPTTDLSGIELPFDRVDIDVEQQSLMLDRAVGQARQVNCLKPDETLLLLDADILVQANLSHLETEPFDVAVTWRAATLKVNGGFLVARNRGQNYAASFFSHFLQVFREDYLAEQQWNGDQLALNKLLPMRKVWSDNVLLSPYEGATIRILHSDTYNYSPADDPEAFADPALRERLILHFKGHRKRFMASHFQELMNSDRRQSSTDPISFSDDGSDHVPRSGVVFG
jgi:hypothetical protein